MPLVNTYIGFIHYLIIENNLVSYLLLVHKCRYCFPFSYDDACPYTHLYTILHTDCNCLSLNIKITR